MEGGFAVLTQGLAFEASKPTRKMIAEISSVGCQFRKEAWMLCISTTRGNKIKKAVLQQFGMNRNSPLALLALQSLVAAAAISKIHQNLQARNPLFLSHILNIKLCRFIKGTPGNSVLN